MLADLVELLTPESRVLDAGAGTGAVSRHVAELQPEAHLTLVDASKRMLDKAADVGDVRLVQDVGELPFEDESFDIITCAWVLETVDDPKAAVTELLRVLSADGFLLYTFCSMPDGWLSRAGSSLLRAAVTEGFAGEFLSPEDTPWHDCDRSRKMSFHGGLSTYVLLRKCCQVEADALPPVRMSDVPSTLR